MHPKSPKWLDDVVRSCQRIDEFTHGFALEDYGNDQLVRHAVERNLIIIAEALSRLERVDSQTAMRISALHQIIALRHRLAHGYDDDIDDAKIWAAIQSFVPTLSIEAESLLAEAEASFEGDT